MAYSYRVEGGGTPSFRSATLDFSSTIKGADGSTTTRMNDAQHTVIHRDKDGNIRTTYDTKNGDCTHVYYPKTGFMADYWKTLDNKITATYYGDDK